MYMPDSKFCVGTQHNLYSTGLRLGFASGKTQLLGFASGKNAKNVRHPTPEIPTCWYILRWATQNSGVHCPTPTPDARYFAFWWNIGFTLSLHVSIFFLNVEKGRLFFSKSLRSGLRKSHFPPKENQGYLKTTKKPLFPRFSEQ